LINVFLVAGLFARRVTIRLMIKTLTFERECSTS
jgi:hypothetical protein